MICTGCCSTLEIIVSYLYKRMSKGGKARDHAHLPPEGDNCLRVLQHQIMRQVLLTYVVCTSTDKTDLLLYAFCTIIILVANNNSDNIDV